MSIIKRRRLAAYRFLKHQRLQVSGKGKIFMFDIAGIPNDMTIDEYLKKWKEIQWEGRHNMQIISSES